MIRLKKRKHNGVGKTPSRTEHGSFIRARRLQLYLTQAELAQQVGLSQTNISAIETGEAKSLNNQKLEIIAKVLLCDPDELRNKLPAKHVPEPKTELRKLIRSRREELGLTLDEFAKKMGITSIEAKNLEIRNNQRIYYKLLTPLATVLNISPATIAQYAGLNRKQTKDELGQKIRLRRRELGMSTTHLAEKLDVSPQFISQIELGQLRLSNSKGMLERFAKVLDLDVNELQAAGHARILKKIKSNSPLGAFLAARRLELGLTQKKLSINAGVSITSIADIEVGLIKPKPAMLNKIAKALEIEIPTELLPKSKQYEEFSQARGQQIKK